VRDGEMVPFTVLLLLDTIRTLRDCLISDGPIYVVMGRPAISLHHCILMHICVNH